VIVASIDFGLELAMRWAHDECTAAVREAVREAMPCSVFEAWLAPSAREAR